MRESQINNKASSSAWSWFKTNIIHETPIIGHTLTAGKKGLSHDVKHFGGMVVGTIAMLELPMPMPESLDSEAEMKFLLFLYMLAYMYVGATLFNVSYNVVGSGVKTLWHTAKPSQDKSEAQEPLYTKELHNTF